MSKKLYPETDIQNIANAIRTLNGSSDTYTVGQMASAIALPENGYYLKESTEANPLSITDGEELNAQSCEVTFSPIQSGSGDPSPENVRPISGRDSLVLSQCGKNIWDELWELGRFNTTSGENVASTTQIRTKNYISIKCGTNVYVKTPLAVWMIFFDSNKNVISDGLPSGSGSSGNSRRIGDSTITIPSECQYIRFYCQDSYGTTYNSDISINYPATDTEYHAYQGTTHTATFPSTVYGGEYEFVSGKAKSEWGYIDLSSLTWFAQNNNIFTATISDIYAMDSTDYSRGMLCTNYKPTNVWWTSLPDKCISHASGTTIAIRDTNYSDKNAFKTAMSGVYLAYELATPIEITLTPETIALLKGNNVLWSDSNGNIKLKYFSKSLS